MRSSLPSWCYLAILLFQGFPHNYMPCWDKYVCCHHLMVNQSVLGWTDGLSVTRDKGFAWWISYWNNTFIAWLAVICVFFMCDCGGLPSHSAECVLWACASVYLQLTWWVCMRCLPEQIPKGFSCSFYCVLWFLMYNCWCKTYTVPHLLDFSTWQLSSIFLIVRLLWLMKTIHFIAPVCCWGENIKNT